MSPWGTTALTMIMVAFGWMMCVISRNEDNRARQYFVKEFRRRRERRLWTLISGRGLHSSTSQLNFSHVYHIKTPYTP